MKKIISFIILSYCTIYVKAQVTPFEKSKGHETATYYEAINYYKELSHNHSSISIKTIGMTDAGYPLHLVLLSKDKMFDPLTCHQNHKVVILINNGIHPGEPDGIDASMMFVRDILNGKIDLPKNVLIGIIPIYNVGGSLNRNSYSRVNQNGPNSFGFRGNAQNLDLNRDFTKSDTKNSKAFATIFHYLNPEILVDNHVSDGADYQHTMTLIATQYDKLGGSLGNFLREKFEPALYKNMHLKGWDMTPYVNFETSTPDKGMEQFYDPPRYSSGYAALFQTVGFMPETHMLKPYSERVRSTYDLMRTMIETSSAMSEQLIEARILTIENIKSSNTFPLSWKADSIQHTEITFKGYEQAYKTSEATGLKRMYYDHTKPFSKQVNYFNHFNASVFVKKPKAYLIPQGWWVVIDLLKLNGVAVNRIKKDTIIDVEAYRIEDYKSLAKAYEKHHKNYNIRVSAANKSINFRGGDYIIYTNNETDRYLVEMLEPTGDDSFFAWNFFDAILQQKEGYSDYRWEDIAAEVLEKDPNLKAKLEAKRQADSNFANNSSAQLDFIYKNSKFYEPEHMQYPVYRLVF